MYVSVYTCLKWGVGVCVEVNVVLGREGRDLGGDDGKPIWRLRGDYPCTGSI